MAKKVEGNKISIKIRDKRVDYQGEDGSKLMGLNERVGAGAQRSEKYLGYEM